MTSCWRAAKNGDLNGLRKAHKNGCEWDWLTCAYAAAKGYLECLQYAHENGCVWDSWTCAEAALNGQLTCLQYAHENGCDTSSFRRSSDLSQIRSRKRVRLGLPDMCIRSCKKAIWRVYSTLTKTAVSGITGLAKTLPTYQRAKPCPLGLQR